MPLDSGHHHWFEGLGFRRNEPFPAFWSRRALSCGVGQSFGRTNADEAFSAIVPMGSTSASRSMNC